jgi:hypothetical protein
MPRRATRSPGCAPGGRRSDGEVFVVDAEGRVTGVVPPQDVAVAPLTKKSAVSPGP